MSGDPGGQGRAAGQSGAAGAIQVTSVIPAGMDPITFEVLSNAFSGVIDEMGIMLEKVSFSTVTSEARDYSCAIANAAGDVVSRGVGDLPLIGGTIHHRLKGILAHIPLDDIREGDVLLHNDPYIGGTHLQDVSAVVPIFWQGELVALSHAASHWPDVGGPVPGSFNSEATSSHGEALVIPPSHIVREGVWNRELERLILRNVRIPQVIQGDLRGLIEAVRTGEQQLHKLLAKYGVETIRSAMNAFMDYSEALLRQEFARLPDGTVSWSDAIDRDPGARTNDPVPVGLDLTIAGNRAIFDFSRSGPQGRGPINCTRAATTSGAVAATKAIFPHIPLNDGFTRAVEIVLPDDCVLNAQHPAPVSGHAANSAEKIVSCVHGCFIQLAPQRGMACPTNLVNISLFGRDERPGQSGDYVMYLWLAGGWGGRPSAGDNHTFMMPLAAGSRLQFAEVLERVYPVRIVGYGLKPDSEGAGRHRGGFGLHSPFLVTHGEATINAQGDREVTPNWGFAGGLPSLGNSLVYAPGTAAEEVIGVMRAGFRVQPGVLVDYSQGGGGGYGNPHEREVGRVVDDVRNELVSLERARDVYGVAIRVVDERLLVFEVDEAETARLRGRP